MLNKIRRHSFVILEDLLDGPNDIFLISNHDTTKWDFARLTQAVLEVLPTRQRETLTLTLNIVTSMSTDILQRKVEVLKRRISKVAVASALAAVVPVPGLSFVIDLALITSEIRLYKLQLGLPEVDSAEFCNLNYDMQERVRKFYLTSGAQISGFLAAYGSQSVLEEASRFIPFVGLAIAGSMSYGSTYYLLHRCLEELEKTALELIEDFKKQTLEEDFEID